MLLIFTGCVSKYQMPNFTNMQQKEFVLQQNNDKYMLVVDAKDSIFRFVVFDMLGVPIVDKTLKNGKFTSMKFLYPSARFDKLFVEILSVIEKDENFVETMIENFKVKNVSI